MVSLVWAIGVGIGFVVAVGAIPVLAAIGPPALIARPLGVITSFVAQVAMGRTVLYQQANGEYIERHPSTIDDSDGEAATDGGSDTLGPPGHWTRWLGSQFALGYDRSSAAWGDAAVETAPDGNPDVEYVEDSLPGEYRHGTAINGGGYRAFYDERERGEDRVLVDWRAALSGIKNGAGLAMANRALGRAMEDYGGDTSEYSPWVTGMVTVIMALMGLGFGLVVFF